MIWMGVGGPGTGTLSGIDFLFAISHLRVRVAITKYVI